MILCRFLYANSKAFASRLTSSLWHAHSLSIEDWRRDRTGRLFLAQHPVKLLDALHEIAQAFLLFAQRAVLLQNTHGPFELRNRERFVRLVHVDLDRSAI